MYSWKLNSPLTNRSHNKGHEGLEGMRENKHTNRKSLKNRTTNPSKKKNKTNSSGINQDVLLHSQHQSFFLKNCMWYGTYLREIEEREERNRWLQKGKKTIQKDRENFQVLWKKSGLVVNILKVESFKRHSYAVTDIISISF